MAYTQYVYKLPNAKNESTVSTWTIARREHIFLQYSLIYSVLLQVYSGVRNSRARLAIRRTWGQSEEYYPAKVRVIFSLALPANPVDQGKIEKEQQTYGDLVQDGMFVDAYRNLTYKVSQFSKITRFS